MKKNLVYAALSLFMLAVFTTSANAQWIQTNWPASNSYFNLYAGGEMVFARTWDGINGGRLFLTADNGTAWTQISSADSDVDILSIVMLPNDILAGTWNGFYRSTSGGASWYAVTPTGIPEDTAIWSIAMIGSTLFAGARGAVYRSSDNGATWTEAKTGIPVDARITSIVASGDAIFAGSDSNGVFITTNFGTSWTAVNSGLADRHISQLTAMGTGLFAVTLNGVFVFDDDDASWAANSSSLENINCLVVGDSQLFAGTDGSGVYVSADGGATWTSVCLGMPSDTRVWSLATNGDDIFAGTSDGVWRAPIHPGNNTVFTVTAGASEGGTISPTGNVTVYEGCCQTFTIAPATGYRISDVSVDGASAGAVASYTFTNVTGVHTIFATFGHITNSAPTISTAASASPSPVTASTTALSVLGADDNGESSLTYTWAAIGTPPAPVTFSVNGINGAKASTVTFTKAGSYTFQVTATDAGGLTATSSVTVTVNQTLTSIIVAPTSATVVSSATQQFSATARDQFATNLAAQPTFTWSVSGGGTINPSGLFTAGTTAGTYTVTTRSGSVSKTASVTVASPNTAPTIATAASASPNPVTGTTATLSALGADDNGESNLTYTWATTGTPPAAVTFSANGTNAAKNTRATFTKAGSYTLRVTLKDAGNLTATSSVAMTVNQTLTSVVLSPTSASIPISTTRQFTATARDQFTASLATQPTFTWSVSGVGTITTSGLFTAGTTAGSSTVTAASGGVKGTASVTVTQATAAVYQINCGGSASSPYTTDQYYSGGTARTVSSTITTTGVTNPAPQAVYRAERYGAVTYTLPSLSAGALYTVRLHFAELYWTATGKRKFNVALNGTTVLSNYDIYAATGARYKAVVHEFTATANTSGQIVIKLTTVTDNATIEGIQIIRQ
jgi:hypothetical protein